MFVVCIGNMGNVWAWQRSMSVASGSHVGIGPGGQEKSKKDIEGDGDVGLLGNQSIMFNTLPCRRERILYSSRVNKTHVCVEVKQSGTRRANIYRINRLSGHSVLSGLEQWRLILPTMVV